MVKYSFLIFLFFLLSTFQKNYSQNFIEEEIILETPTGNLYGTLTIPTKGKKHALALIISGSGPTDRNGNSLMMQGKNNSLLLLSHELAENKIATVRFDKRGVSASRKSGFSEQDLRFDHYVYDVVFWLRKLKTDKRFKKIGIIGHSEGSLIGMVAATKEETDFYISIAGAAIPANEIISKQLAGQADKIKIDANRIMDKLNEGFTVDSINPMLFSIFRPSVQPYLISWFAYNPAKIITNLEVPILIVQGTSDIQIETKNGELLSKASNNSKLLEIENMNHVLKITGDDMAQNIAAYTNPDLALAPDLSNEVASFIKKGK
jgi:pimeloyl-ACP methyl ester carboxylesterase